MPVQEMTKQFTELKPCLGGDLNLKMDNHESLKYYKNEKDKSYSRIVNLL